MRRDHNRKRTSLWRCGFPDISSPFALSRRHSGGSKYRSLTPAYSPLFTTNGPIPTNTKHLLYSATRGDSHIHNEVLPQSFTPCSIIYFPPHAAESCLIPTANPGIWHCAAQPHSHLNPPKPARVYVTCHTSSSVDHMIYGRLFIFVSAKSSKRGRDGGPSARCGQCWGGHDSKQS